MKLNNRILLVEDDHCTRELIEEILADEGYAIRSVENGLEAQELLKKSHFDLLITDFRMPGLDGVELLKWCQTQNIKSAVMFMTANTNLIREEASALSDLDAALITKPLNLDLFLKTINKTLTQLPRLESICS